MQIRSSGVRTQVYFKLGGEADKIRLIMGAYLYRRDRPNK